MSLDKVVDWINRRPIAVVDQLLSSATAKSQDDVVWLRQADAGTDNECWVICNRADPGATPFSPSEATAA
ncbi:MULTISPECIES: hypothetical protein [unclassified Bradyrhizobium]